MLASILAVTIFLAMFVLIVLDKIEHYLITLGCGLLTIIFVLGICLHSGQAIMEVLNVKSIFTTSFWHTVGQASEDSNGISWATIIFIAGMMVMVEGMKRAGFFTWLCMLIAKLVRYRIVPILITFMILSAFLSMFIASITVILFLAAVTVELSQLFCSNLGGTATVCGDPPNIIIGTSLGFSFFDFLTNTGVFVLISLVIMIVYFYLAFRKELKQNEGGVDTSTIPSPSEAITDKSGFIFSCVIFLLSVVLLLTQTQTGLTVAAIGVIIAIITLICSGRHGLELLKKIDYKTLLFFIVEVIAKFIKNVSGGNMYIMVAIIIWLSAICSAFIDNVPFAATMVPVIKELAAGNGGVLAVLAYSLAIGTDIGGNATPIGASANVVGTSVAAKAGHPVGWGEYCKKMAPATILVMIICTLGVFIRYNSVF